MATRIQLRRDTTTNWSNNNPVLSIGEIGYDTVLKKFKIGDGTTAWNALLFPSLTLEDITDITISNSEDGKILGVVDGGFSLIDPADSFSGTPAEAITTTNISNWDTAYGWGDHGAEGYLLATTAASTYQPIGNYPVLTDGKLSDGVLPAIAITDTFVVSSESAMLALTAETGDVAIRTDINSTFILSAGPALILSNWKELLTPANGVQSVSGTAPISSTGGVNPTLSISLAESDIPMIPISKVTNLQTNLDAKATTVDYSTTLPSTGWSGSGPFEIQVTTNLNAIVDTDKPIIDLDMTSVAFADVDTVNTEWAKVYRAVSGTGNITFYAKEVPTVALVLQVKVVK
jgi:hypothetical protein